MQKRLCTLHQSCDVSAVVRRHHTCALGRSVRSRARGGTPPLRRIARRLVLAAARFASASAASSVARARGPCQPETGHGATDSNADSNVHG